MSYDLQLVSRASAPAFLAKCEAEPSADDLVINPGPIVPEREAWKASVRDALLAEEPALEPFAFGFEEIASSEGISLLEARVRYRHIELNLPEVVVTGAIQNQSRDKIARSGVQPPRGGRA